MNQRKKILAELLFVSLLVLTQVWPGARPGAAQQTPEPSPTPRLIAELQHEGWVSDAGLSPDGRFLATCSFIDQTVRVWDVEKATEVRRMVAGPVWAVAISPDGRLLAASIEGAETLLIDISKWVVLKKLGRGHPEFLCCRASVAFSPDGATLLVGGQGSAVLWDVGSGRELKSFDAGGKVSSVAFSPDGRFVALAVEDIDTLLVIEVSTGREERRIAEGLFFATSVAFSPDGKTILGGSHAGTRIWNIATGERLQSFSAGMVQAATFTPDGRRVLLAGRGESRVGSLTLWEVKTGERVASFGDAAQKYGLALARDGCTARPVARAARAGAITGAWRASGTYAGGATRRRRRRCRHRARAPGLTSPP